VKDLEGAEPQKEVEAKTPEKEAKEPTPTEQKPTVGKLYTQEDLDKAVGKATSTINKQVTLSKTQADAEKARADRFEGELGEMRKELDSLMTLKFEDDPNGLNDYRRKQELAQLAKGIEEREEGVKKAMWAIQMRDTAQELSEEHGIPLSELKECQSEVEMHKKTTAWLKEQKQEKKSEVEEYPKFDSAISTRSGLEDWEQVRAAYIKNPNNPAVFKRYMEMRRERDAQR